MSIASILETSRTLADILDLATGGNGITIVMGSTAIIILTLVIFEFKNIKKWTS
jgi:hypothetical protein